MQNLLQHQMSVFNRLHPDRVAPIDQSRVYRVDDDGTSHVTAAAAATTTATSWCQLELLLQLLLLGFIIIGA